MVIFNSYVKLPEGKFVYNNHVKVYGRVSQNQFAIENGHL